MNTKYYLVRGRHGETALFAHLFNALNYWAETNTYQNYADFARDFGDQIEHVSKDTWLLDECGRVDALYVLGDDNED